ncbi:hypothetical protein FGO68_gene7940 [Halteria grandinella]|uniref:Uncharacterized protein n=1 Tax=Halteria grandinella TaxID=5974 RepID=A0A8J8NVF2_HALGN|nr:hypothetical protein FGO68_gene7940 [Halteria grandinella]
MNGDAKYECTFKMGKQSILLQGQSLSSEYLTINEEAKSRSNSASRIQQIEEFSSILTHKKFKRNIISRDSTPTSSSNEPTYFNLRRQFDPSKLTTSPAIKPADNNSVKLSINIEKNFNKPRQIEYFDSLEQESQETTVRPRLRLNVQESLGNSELVQDVSEDVSLTIVDDPYSNAQSITEENNQASTLPQQHNAYSSRITDQLKRHSFGDKPESFIQKQMYRYMRQDNDSIDTNGAPLIQQQQQQFPIYEEYSSLFKQRQPSFGSADCNFHIDRGIQVFRTAASSATSIKTRIEEIKTQMAIDSRIIPPVVPPLGNLTNAIHRDSLSEKSTEKTGSRRVEKENIDINVKVMAKSKSKGDLTSRRASNISKLSQKPPPEQKPKMKKQNSQRILTSRPIPLRKPEFIEQENVPLTARRQSNDGLLLDKINKVKRNEEKLVKDYQVLLHKQKEEKLKQDDMINRLTNQIQVLHNKVAKRQSSKSTEKADNYNSELKIQQLEHAVKELSKNVIRKQSPARLDIQQNLKKQIQEIKHENSIQQQFLQIDSQIQHEKLIRQQMLADQVQKENKVTKLRQKLAKLQEKKYLPYDEAKQKLDREQQDCNQVKREFIGQLYNLKERITSFRKETIYSQSIINNEMHMFATQVVGGYANSLTQIEGEKKRIQAMNVELEKRINTIKSLFN